MKKLNAFVAFISIFLLQSLNSCSSLEVIYGSGIIVSSNREVSGFNAIKTSFGIEIFVTQTDSEAVRIETDDNLQEYVKVEVKERELKISKEKAFMLKGRIKAYVSVKSLEKIDASSGAHVKTENQILTDIMKIDASSGADIKMDIVTKYLKGNSSSGSHIHLKGIGQVIDMQSSSGAGIHAEALLSETARANTSSGAHIEIYAKEEVIAEASSGGQIKVFGNPASRNVKKSSGGGVDFE